MTPTGSSSAKKPSISFTPGARVRIRSAGPKDEAVVSSGLFRGLVSVGGDNALAVELDDTVREEKGRIRLIPLNAVLTIDVLEAGKAEEEKRSESQPSPGYFR